MKVLIVGGGASGMFSAVLLGRSGAEVHLLEKNDRLGKKLFITGKGRCNLTNACDVEDALNCVVTNKSFLTGSFYRFTPRDVMDFFEEAGVPLKVERGNRVFPESDHSRDIVAALEREMKKAGVRVHLNTEVREILTEEGKASGVRAGGKVLPGDRIIIATGGCSYPATGSTGDGYRFARETGHTVTELRPSLVPLLAAEEYVHRLAGLSLKNVRLTVKRDKKTLFQDFGEMLFTHQGVSGPLVLTASAVLGKEIDRGGLRGTIDLKPALTPEQLDQRLLRELEAGSNKQFKNVIPSLFPASLTPVMIELGGIPPEKKGCQVTREERLSFGALIKNFPFTVTGRGGFEEAVITRGGVSVRQVHPGTMESKIIKGLYFTGEVLDVDALTGGYNLQIAWSTAASAAGACMPEGGKR